MIELHNVFKRYGSRTRDERIVLDDANWTVPRGGFVGLVGRSGCGKTTVLNLMGGLCRPDSGKIRLDGHDLGSMSDHDLAQFRNQTIGFVFQHFFLRPRRSAADNVIVPLLFGRSVPRNLRARAMETLDLVGLTEFADKPVGNMSGGQRQRVAIARALVTQPSLVLADEPTGNLDVDTGYALFELLRNLQKGLGTTIVIVTHDSLVERLHLPLYTVAQHRILEVPEGMGLAHLDKITVSSNST